MIEYKLNDFYDKYKKVNGLERIAFGTLYKMYGGKRKVDSYSIEMVWYLSTLVYMDAANKLYRDKVLKYEREYNRLQMTNEKNKLEKEFKKDSFDFYSRCFITCLFNLKHYFDIDYETEKRDNSWYIYNIFGSNGLFVSGSACLMKEYAQGESLKGFRKIFIELYGCNKGEWIKDYDLANVDMNLWHYIYNTKLQIKERDFPEIKYKIGEC